MESERAHKGGGPKVSTNQATVAKLASYKGKKKILSKCNCFKGTGIYINEDFSKETIEIRKHNVNRLKELLKQVKYAILAYNRIWIR